MDTSNKRPVLPPDQRDQLLIECKADLLSWAKKRFWFVVVLVTVVGFFGFSTLIREAVRMSVDKRLDIELKRVDRAVQRAENITEETVRAGIRAEDRAATAAAVAKEADRQAKEYAKTISELQRELGMAQENLDVLQQSAKLAAEKYLKLDGEAGNIRGVIEKDVKNLEARLERLDELVAKLASEQQRDPKTLENYRKEVAAKRREAEELGKRFADNARYRVSIFFNERTKGLSDKALEKLTQAGFKASALNKTEAREFLSVAQMNVPKAQMSAGPDLYSLKVNVITYTPDAKSKAEEVRELLASLPEVKRLELLPRQVFAERFGDSFFTQAFPKPLFASNLIEIYLARGT